MWDRKIRTIRARAPMMTICEERKVLSLSMGRKRGKRDGKRSVVTLTRSERAAERTREGDRDLGCL